MRWPRLKRRSPGLTPHATDAAHDRHARDRARMVFEQLETRGIHDPELLRAFATVERHRFVDEAEPYGDHALPVGSGQTISQPFVVAMMTASARPPGGYEGAPVLEVGTGSGYQAAILAELGALVTSIERHPELANSARHRLDRAGYGDRIDVVLGDGTQGWKAGSPYRSILVTAGGPAVPTPLLEQLDRSGGRLVMPVGSRMHQNLTLIERDGEDWHSTTLEPVVFVPLIGEHGYRDET
jgi:protein-L-isoaspartate(D-aspartate) O-methyltransferase